VLRSVTRIAKVKTTFCLCEQHLKADAVYNAFCGPITPFCPASILQLHTMVLVGDKAASWSPQVPVCE
ncbi:MAG: hypothetical protein ACLSAF_05810, partial [Intestinimonas sp.]